MRPSSIRWMDWGMVWNGRCLTAKISASPQSRKRVYLVGYLDERCRGKILPFTETAGTPLKQIRPGAQGERVYSTEGVSCTLTSQAGGMGGKTGLYCTGVPIKENTKKGYKMAYPGDSVDLAYDNLELKQILDVIAAFLMEDDSGLLIDAYNTTETGKTDCTEISVMEKRRFSDWIKEHEKHLKNISDF